MKRKYFDNPYGNKYESLVVRRGALLAMGFCPSCMRYSDNFPATECSKCLKVKRDRYHARKQSKIQRYANTRL